MKKILYLGLSPERYRHSGDLKHYPVIRIEPYSINAPGIQQALQSFDNYTHLIFTSQNAVKIVFSFLSRLEVSMDQLQSKSILAIGQATASCLADLGFPASDIAQEESAEGIIDQLRRQDLSKAFVFYPRSALSRPAIEEFLQRANVHYCSCAIYDTKPQKLLPLPNLNEFDELVFTSPSTVDAFLEIFGHIPWDKKITSIGPITEGYLKTRVLDKPR